MPEGLPIVTLDGAQHAIRSTKPGISDISVWEAAWAKLLDQAPGRKAVLRLKLLNEQALRNVAFEHIEAAARVRAAIEDAIWAPAPAEEEL